MANKDGDLIPIVRCFDGGFAQLELAAATWPDQEGCFVRLELAGVTCCHQAVAADKGTTMASTSLA